ncbi:hypothetical protein CCP4SC76_300001 [Gammaproteobacteria bacterium]
MNKEQHSTRYSKIIETLRLSSQSGSNLPEFLDAGCVDCLNIEPLGPTDRQRAHLDCGESSKLQEGP